MIAVKGCPPRWKDIADILNQAGIAVDRVFLEDTDRFPAMLLARFEGRSAFNEACDQVK